MITKLFDMNIQTEKIAIMKLILETDNPRILESVKGLFNRSKNADFWESLPVDQREDILLGISEIDNGEIVDYEDLMIKFSN